MVQQILLPLCLCRLSLELKNPAIWPGPKQAAISRLTDAISKHTSSGIVRSSWSHLDLLSCSVDAGLRCLAELRARLGRVHICARSGLVFEGVRQCTPVALLSHLADFSVNLDSVRSSSRAPYDGIIRHHPTLWTTLHLSISHSTSQKTRSGY